MPGNSGLSAAAARRLPAPSTRPGSGDVVGWGGTRPPRPPKHTRAHTHLRRGKLRPRTERTPAKVTSGGGAGSGSGSERPWTPRPTGPTRRGRVLGKSARDRRLRAHRGKSGRARRGAGLCGPRRASRAAVVSRARALCGLAGSGDPAPPVLQAGLCGVAPGTRRTWPSSRGALRTAQPGAGDSGGGGSLPH